jgi:hypothetical protein
VKVFLADFSQATDITNLYPVTNGTANYVYFDSTTFSELGTDAAAAAAALPLLVSPLLLLFLSCQKEAAT